MCWFVSLFCHRKKNIYKDPLAGDPASHLPDYCLWWLDGTANHISRLFKGHLVHCLVVRSEVISLMQLRAHTHVHTHPLIPHIRVGSLYLSTSTLLNWRPFPFPLPILSWSERCAHSQVLLTAAADVVVHCGASWIIQSCSSSFDLLFLALALLGFGFGYVLASSSSYLLRYYN